MDIRNHTHATKGVQVICLLGEDAVEDKIDGYAAWMWRSMNNRVWRGALKVLQGLWLADLPEADRHELAE